MLQAIKPLSRTHPWSPNCCCLVNPSGRWTNFHARRALGKFFKNLLSGPQTDGAAVTHDLREAGFLAKRILRG